MSTFRIYVENLYDIIIYWVHGVHPDLNLGCTERKSGCTVHPCTR